MNLSIRVEIFKEDDLYVALSPELNVSSFGETIDGAKESIKEAIEAFLEECREMGTLDEVLEESGFSHVRQRFSNFSLLKWLWFKNFVIINFTFST